MVEPIAAGSAFAAGLLSFFSPCILPLLPVYLANLSGSNAGGVIKPRLGQTLLFVSGLSAVFVALGFGFGALGSFLVSQTFLLVCGAAIVLFGLVQTGLFRLPILEREKRFLLGKRGGGYLSAFLLGFAFSFGWTPCIGPVLAGILGLAAGEGSPLQGAFLMSLYAAGLSVPFLVLSVFSDALLGRFKRLGKYTGAMRVVTGCILVVMGLLLMTNRLNDIAVWF